MPLEVSSGPEVLVWRALVHVFFGVKNSTCVARVDFIDTGNAGTMNSILWTTFLLVKDTGTYLNLVSMAGNNLIPLIDEGRHATASSDDGDVKDMLLHNMHVTGSDERNGQVCHISHTDGSTTKNGYNQI